MRHKEEEAGWRGLCRRANPTPRKVKGGEGEQGYFTLISRTLSRVQEMETKRRWGLKPETQESKKLLFCRVKDCGFCMPINGKTDRVWKASQSISMALKARWGREGGGAVWAGRGGRKRGAHQGILFLSIRTIWQASRGEAAVIRGAKDAAMLLGYEAADFVLEDRKEAQAFGSDRWEGPKKRQEL